jgi:hypothetical protein
MPIRYKKSRRYKRKGSRRSSRKSSRKGSRKILKAGNGDKVQCCMCGKMVNKDYTMSPSGCLMKHGEGAHRICQDCWWNPEKGFGRENASHECPGCLKGLPLTPFEKKDYGVIDLTDDD